LEIYPFREAANFGRCQMELAHANPAVRGNGATLQPRFAHETSSNPLFLAHWPANAGCQLALADEKKPPQIEKAKTIR